ncbi:sulfatase/phosphatase domain-containing protein [Rubinisphaera brasiliensis]|uniref:sulfatase/phosphatase domain-containing protein n=1 Tax=Rubinisphaera brasiliensis TaxID=119 RepID=UPI0001E71AC1|nr:sulfatase/phosphatase domain-containing protein [Rubinisphaera brasiliensis]
MIYGVGDNGASAEGGFSGSLNDIAAGANSYRPDIVADALKRLDEIGGPTTSNHFPVGWAMAMNSPLKFAKRQASHFGGTRNGLVISWPGHIDGKGGIRTQFHHAVDITPTILEAAGVPAPKVANGIKQKPMAGTSMVYTFDAAGKDAPSRRTTQYFEIGGTRAIYDNGWVAATSHGLTPWSNKRSKFTFEDDEWELYNITQDFTEHDNLAEQFPEKLAELKKKFMAEARKRQVLPLNDQNAALFNGKVAGRPSGPVEGLKKLTYYSGMTRLPEGSAPDLKNRSYSLTAEIEVPENGANGVLITQGGLFSGWALMLQDGKPVFVYNWMQEEFTTITGEKLSPGKHSLRFDFTYDGGGLGKGGQGVLSVDGKKVAEKRIEKTVPNRYSLDETMDVGEDSGTAVSPDYQVPNRFTGTLKKIVVELN